MEPLTTRQRLSQGGLGSSIDLDNATGSGWHFDWRELSDRLATWNTEMPMPKGLCLEIGIGSHHYRKAVEELGYSWVGLDISPRTDCIIVGDAHGLPFQNGVFSLVIMRCVIEHLKNPWIVLKEVHRVLTREAYVCGTVSFLEPFHNSYYHFTHWGVEQLLMDTDFSWISIEPGASYYLPLVASLFPDFRVGSRLGSLLGKLVIKPILTLQKTLGWCYVVARFGQNSDKYERFIKYQAENPLRYAGHISFLAQKI